MRLATLLIFLLTSSPTLAAKYEIDKDNSEISFSGKHIETNFTGILSDYKTIIDFDKNDLANSSISADINLTSFSTGNQLYDGTLPEQNWFNLKTFKSATFTSDKLTHKSGNTFLLDGAFTLKGITKPLQFLFTLRPATKDEIKVTAHFKIDRLAYKVGTESDPQAEWVDRHIQINLELTATKMN